VALDPATELQELNAILASGDDPDTKRMRIASLYNEPAANDPGGMPAEATAMGSGGAGGVSGMGDTGPGNVPDVPAEMPGATGAGGTLGMPPPDLLAQSGTSGPGNVPAGAPVAPPMAATEAPVARPAPARVTTIPETTVRGSKARSGGATESAIPPWLAKEMGAPESYYGKPDLVGRPVTRQEDAGYRALEGAIYEGTREQAEAEDQAIQAGARAELAAVERGQIVDAEMARRELERQNNLAAMERGYQEMLAEAAREPIDSERLWNNKSTGEKILSKIALFIGTLAGGVQGNPMMMMNKMDQDVERDIQAQKANKAFALHRLAAEGTLYGMARDRFASEQSVDAAMRETAWRRIGAELNSFMTQAQDPQRKAAIGLLVDNTESKILEAERQRRLLNDADTIARARASMAGRAVKPPPRNEVKDLVEGLSIQDGIIKKLERMKTLTGPTMNRVWGTAEKGQAETLRHKLQLDYKRGEQTGTLDKGSLDFFDSMIGTPEDLFRSPSSEAKLDQLIQDARAKQTQLQRDFETMQSVKTGPAAKGAGGTK
jgi:hypothetical protein